MEFHIDNMGFNIDNKIFISILWHNAGCHHPSSVGGDSAQGGGVSHLKLKPKEAEEKRKEAGIR